MNVFEAGVTLHLVDKVSSGLGVIAKGFARNERAAAALQKRIDKIHHTFQSGLIVAGAGMALAAPLIHATNAAQGYIHQLNQMKTAGLSNAEMAKSVAAAWATSGKVITSTAEENLKIIMDLRSVFGHTQEGIDYMPRFAKIQGAYASVLDGKMAKQADAQSFSMAKALETIGRINSKEEFDRSSNAMFRSTVAMGGRVLPSDYQQVFKYANQAKFGLGDEFLWKKLPELILEKKTAGGGGASRAGTEIAALYRFGVQGIMNKQAAHNLMDIGLIGANQMMKTSTTGTTLVGGVKGKEVLAKDPVQWVTDVFMPALIKAKHLDPNNKDAIIMASNQVFKGNALATALVAEIIKKPFIFERSKHLYDQTDGIDAAYDKGMANDPKINQKAFHAAMENLNVSIGMHVLPVVIPMINKLSKALQQLALHFKDHPGQAKALAGFIAISSGLLIAAGSALVTKSAFMGLALIFGPIKAGLASLAILGPALKGLIGFVSMVSNLFVALGPIRFLLTAFPMMAGSIAKVGMVALRFTVIGAAVAAVITAVVLVVQNWSKIMAFVHENHRFFIHIAVQVVKAGDWLNKMLKQMIAALGQAAAAIGGFIASIPGLANFGNSIKTAAVNAMKIDNKTAAEDAMFLRGRGLGSLVDAARGQTYYGGAANPGRGLGSMMDKSVNNFYVQQVPGHDHEACAKNLKKATQSMGHKASAASGNTVGRAYATHGNGRP